jgi:hypothetical protein
MGLFDGGGSSNAAFGFGEGDWEPIGGSYTEPDFKIDWHGGDAYKNSPFGSASEAFMWGANNPGAVNEIMGRSGQSPSFSDQFGKNFLDAYKSQKMGAGSGSTGKTSVGVTPGSAGGHQVTGLGDKSRTKLIQYIHPTAQVIPGGPGTPGRPGIGERALDAGITAGIGALFGCDERIIVDIAPLESTEVNDALADVAFFVKEIRECA